MPFFFFWDSCMCPGAMAATPWSHLLVVNTSKNTATTWGFTLQLTLLGSASLPHKTQQQECYSFSKCVVALHSLSPHKWHEQFLPLTGRALDCNALRARTFTCSLGHFGGFFSFLVQNCLGSKGRILGLSVLLIVSTLLFSFSFWLQLTQRREQMMKGQLKYPLLLHGADLKM